jgi:hypothetical protein
VFGDTHIGSSTALAPPKFTIHNTDKREVQVVNHNPLQEWLWSNWVDLWDYVKVLAGVRGRHRKNRIVVAHMGDVIDGNHHDTKQIIQDVNDQYLVALDILRPIFDMADASFGIIGTEAHAGNGGEGDLSIYRELGATDYGQVLNLEIDGKLHDLAHHGRVGGRPWTSAAASIAVEVCLDCGNQGIPFPDYIWRGHSHIIDDSGLKVPYTRCITLPSWQLKTTFGYRVASNRPRSDIGGFIVNGGVLDDTKSRYEGQPDKRKVIHV